MSRERRSPRQLVCALEALRERLAPETLLAEVQRVWHQTVGEAISVEAKPTAERAGIVTVSCSGSAWAQELDLMSPEIVARINRLLAGDQVSGLRCVVGPPRRMP